MLRSINLSLVCALLSGLIYGLFHMHFMQQFADTDQVAYTSNISYSFSPGAFPVYNPHHLHFEIGGKIFHKWMVKHFGSAGFTDLVFNLRLRSLLAACLGIVFSVLFFRDITGKLIWGLLGAALIGSCHAYLLYATKIDTAIFPASALILILWLFHKMTTVRRGLLLHSVAAGAVLFAGVMAHQYMAFTCIAVCLCLMLPAGLFPDHKRLVPFVVFATKGKPQIDSSGGRRMLSVLVAAVLALALIAAAYFYAGKTEYNLFFDKPNIAKSHGGWRHITFQKWIFAYELAVGWGRGIKDFDPKHPFRGFTDAFLAQKSGPKWNQNPNFQYDGQDLFSPAAIVHNQLAIFYVLALGGAIFFLPALWRRYRRITLLLLLCTITYFLFFTYWEPFHLEFWLIPSMLICVWLVLELNLLAETISSRLGAISRLPFYVYTLILIFLFLSHNALYHLAPYSRTRITQGVSREWFQKRFQRFFKGRVYKYPDNVYREAYTEVRR